MADAERAELEREWLGLKSQRSGISFRYLLMLVGEEGVNPDRMILRYLSSRIPGQPTLSLPDAVEAAPSGRAHGREPDRARSRNLAVPHRLTLPSPGRPPSSPHREPSKYSRSRMQGLAGDCSATLASR